MVQRRGARRSWLIPQPLWMPALAVGLWLVSGARFSIRDVGHRQWSVQLLLPTPQHWFQDPFAWLGLGLAVLGLGLLVWARLRPAWYRSLTVARYAGFGVASFLLVVLAGALALRLSGHVMEAARGGLDWRFIASVRGHWLDQALAWTAAALGATAYAFSYGRPPLRQPRAIADNPDEP